MKRVSLVLIFFLIFTSFVSLNAQWAKVYGMNFITMYSSDFYSIQQTSDGGYIIASGANYDMWVLKLDSAGGIEWQRAYGGSESDSANSIQQTSDGGYIVAGDFWVLKLDSAGNIEWQRDYRVSDLDGAFSIQQTSDGGFIVGGSTVWFGAGRKDIWVLKLDSTGGIEWQRAYGGSEYDSANSIQQTSDGGFIVGGSTRSFDAGSGDILVLKLDSTGGIEWQRAYGGSESDSANSIQQTSDGGYVVVGETTSFGAGSRDSWVLKLDSTGEIEWQRTYGRFGNENGTVGQQISDGGYIIVCKTEYHVPQQEYGIEPWHWTWMILYYDAILILKISSNGDINPSCELIGSSNASVLDTGVTPYEISIIPQDIDLAPIDTNIVPQDTDADVNRFWPDPTIFDLSISSTSGGHTEPPEHSYYTFVSGTDISIKAFPKDRYRFNGWTGDVSAGYENDNPITITIDSDKSITANFTATPPEEAGKKGGCFIATAAYGSPLHPYVNILRDFRDKYLMSKRPGRVLVNFYYKYSPFIAELIANHKVLRVAVRINLLPLVVFSYSMLHFGPTITAFMLAFVFALPIFFIWFYRRK